MQIAEAHDRAVLDYLNAAKDADHAELIKNYVAISGVKLQNNIQHHKALSKMFGSLEK